MQLVVWWRMVGAAPSRAMIEAGAAEFVNADIDPGSPFSIEAGVARIFTAMHAARPRRPRISAARVERVVALRSGGASLDEIQRQTGVARETACRIAVAAGISQHPRRPFTAEEDAQIKARWPQASARSIADDLGRHWLTVYHRATKRLGLPAKRDL